MQHFFGLLLGVEFRFSGFIWEPSMTDSCWSSRARACTINAHNNNNNTIWRGSVLTGEEPPPHSGELKHALLQAGGPTQSQLSRPMSSGHHISVEHRLLRKQLNSDTNASNKTFLKEIQENRKEETFFLRKKRKKKKIKREKRKGNFLSKTREKRKNGGPKRYFPRRLKQLIFFKKCYKKS